MAIATRPAVSMAAEQRAGAAAAPDSAAGAASAERSDDKQKPSLVQGCAILQPDEDMFCPFSVFDDEWEYGGVNPFGMMLWIEHVSAETVRAMHRMYRQRPEHACMNLSFCFATNNKPNADIWRADILVPGNYHPFGDKSNLLHDVLFAQPLQLREVVKQWLLRTYRRGWGDNPTPVLLPLTDYADNLDEWMHSHVVTHRIQLLLTASVIMEESELLPYSFSFGWGHVERTDVGLLTHGRDIQLVVHPQLSWVTTATLVQLAEDLLFAQGVRDRYDAFWDNWPHDDRPIGWKPPQTRPANWLQRSRTTDKPTLPNVPIQAAVVAHDVPVTEEKKSNRIDDDDDTHMCFSVGRPSVSVVGGVQLNEATTPIQQQSNPADEQLRKQT